jgi:putative transposase
VSTNVGYLSAMMTTSKSIDRGYRFPAEVIQQAVWLYFRFPPSLRMVENLLAARGIIVSHETVRYWAETFGRIYASKIRRRAPQFGDKWHLDEVVISINGKKYWLWRAVDADGFVLDALVQSREGSARSAEALAQVDTKAIPRAARDGHRQARFLRRCPNRDGHDLRASPAQGPQQPGREFAPADAEAQEDQEDHEEDHEAVQIRPTPPALRLHPRCGRQPPQLSPPRHVVI